LRQPHSDVAVARVLAATELAGAAQLVRIGDAAQADKDPYLEFLRERAGKVIYRAPYAGNAGDSLIQFATTRILSDLAIRTTVDAKKADVILIPGGNPSMWPESGSELWRRLSAQNPRAELVVGPAGFNASYPDWERLVNDPASRVSGLFARDPMSLAALRAAGLRTGITFALSHDPALYLRDSEWIAAHRDAATTDYDLAAFRDDHETNLGYDSLWRSARSLLPKRVHLALMRRRAATVRARKIALARRTPGDTAPLPFVCTDVSQQRFELFVETIRAARNVHTDRLHVMLLAAMLGKKVFAYPTAYAKLEGVYSHSIARWTDVTLVRM
jgi:exopolysaccharide biosynthesis predicted pyruvyltransferase EpsI